MSLKESTNKHNNMICEPCPEGKRLLTSCNVSHQSVCVDCPRDTFSDKKDNRKECTRCQICGRRELIKTPCSKRSNTICECRPGYIYRPFKPCFKCPHGFIADHNTCKNMTKAALPHPIDGNSNLIVIGSMSAGILILVICLILLFWKIYKRRNDRLGRQDGGNTPDVLRNIKTPPLPPKGTRRRDNEYSPAPQVLRPLVESKLVSRNLPFSLVHDMNMMLTHTHESNYAHLATELGYDDKFVNLLASESQPVEVLMDHYMSSVNPTKERLYESLVAIGRDDVAQMVWDEI